MLILGAGDTAMDCASAASRLGGEVTVAFRKAFKGMRASTKEIEHLLTQGIEFLPLFEPTNIDNGTVTFQMQEYGLDGKRHQHQSKAYMTMKKHLELNKHI